MSTSTLPALEEDCKGLDDSPKANPKPTPKKKKADKSSDKEKSAKKGGGGGGKKGRPSGGSDKKDKGGKKRSKSSTSSEESGTKGPKRPMTAYIFYSRMNHKAYREAHANEPQTSIMKELAKQWNEIKDTDKSKSYYEMAEKDRQRYEKECEEQGITIKSKKRKPDPTAPTTGVSSTGTSSTDSASAKTAAAAPISVHA